MYLYETARPLHPFHYNFSFHYNRARFNLRCSPYLCFREMSECSHFNYLYNYLWNIFCIITAVTCRRNTRILLVLLHDCPLVLILQNPTVWFWNWRCRRRKSWCLTVKIACEWKGHPRRSVVTSHRLRGKLDNEPQSLLKGVWGRYHAMLLYYD